MRIAAGVDLVQVSRIRRLIEENAAAEREIFTERELRYCAGRRDRYPHLAARFAAKEAVLKALGTGVGPGIRWTDVEVVNTPLGKPRLRLAGKPARDCAAGGVTPEISLSHTGDFAVAHAVLLFRSADAPAPEDPAPDAAAPGSPAPDAATAGSSSPASSSPASSVRDSSVTASSPPDSAVRADLATVTAGATALAAGPGPAHP